MSGWVFLGSTGTNQRIKCLAQAHNAVPPVRLEPATPQSRVKHSTTEPLPSSCKVTINMCLHSDLVRIESYFLLPYGVDAYIKGSGAQAC